MAKGGLCLGSVYLRDGLGLKGENVAVFEAVEAALRRVEGPWILGGDWNVAPDKLVAWAKSVGGVVFAPHEATCLARAGSIIDFFCT